MTTKPKRKPIEPATRRALENSAELEHIARALRPLAWDVTRLAADPENAREHSAENLDRIERSLRAHGQQKPIVVYTGKVIAGNGTLEVATKRLGWKALAVVEFEGAPEQARDYAIADNAAGELATWRTDVLARALEAAKESGTLDATGFTEKELAKLAEQIRLEATTRHNGPPAELEQGFLDAAVRQIVLAVRGSEFDEVSKLLAQARAKAEKNPELLAHLDLAIATRSWQVPGYEDVIVLLEKARKATGAEDNTTAVIAALRYYVADADAEEAEPEA